MLNKHSTVHKNGTFLPLQYCKLVQDENATECEYKKRQMRLKNNLLIASAMSFFLCA